MEKIESNNSNGKYLISVVVPFYNAENELKTSIDSVIGQTFGFENIELILVDDASTDNSCEIIKQYQKKYDNIKLFQLSENSGLPGKPRSMGTDFATSKYVVYLDCDDCYKKDAFKILYDAIEMEKSDFVIASHYMNLDGDVIKTTCFSTDEDILSFNPLKNQEIFDKFSYNHLVAPWGKIYNREFISKNNIRFPEDSLCEDAYFYFGCLINSDKVTVLPKNYVYVYNTFDDKKTAIHGHDVVKFNNYLKGIRYIIDLLKNIDLSINVFLDENISSLLLIFSNLKKSDKKNTVLKIYEFEKDLDVNISRKEIAVLNNCIMKKRFSLAILISGFYSGLYNNKFIKNFYRKINNS